MMPYDYYEYLKKRHESDKYQETTDLVREHLWNEAMDFNMSNNWLEIENKIRIHLYLFLRYQQQIYKYS